MTKYTKEQCGICAECVPQVNGGSGFTNCADAHAAETAGDKLQLTNKQLIEHAEAQITYLRAALDIQPDVGASEMLCLMEIALKVLAAPELPQPTLDDEWVSVPVEPTQEMLNAWLSEIANWRGHVAGYKAMLAATPQQGVKSALAAGMARYGDAMQKLAKMEGSSDAE